MYRIITIMVVLTSLCFGLNASTGTQILSAKCGHPGVPVYGFIISEEQTFPVEPGTEISFGCCPDYEIIGYTNLTCLSNGTWDLGTPVCNPVCKPWPEEAAYNGSCYHIPRAGFAKHRNNFFGADTYCRTSGYYLASIGSQEEHMFLKEMLRSDDFHMWRYFVGANRNNDLREWRWISGHKWTYDPWRVDIDPPEPNDGEIKQCAVLIRTRNVNSSYDMEDRECVSIRYILCERGNAVMCDYPGEPENGVTLSSIAFPAQDGETVTFVCNDGFDLSGSGTIVCEVVEEGNSTCPSGYRWNDTVPRCVPQQCEYGMYEDYCRQMCRCIMDNTLSCDQDDGTCRCKPGWTGHTCNQTCPVGWYGDNCLQSCKCISNTTMRCDRYNGTCYCRDGWSGDKCDAMDDDSNGFSNETSSGPPDEDNTTTVLLSDIAIAGIAICVFFVTVIVLVMIFCIVKKSRNRKKTGGEEVSNERRSTSERICVEFDNQAYSQDEAHYATLQGNPIAEQQGTRIAVEGPYASLGETQGDVDLGLHGSEKKQP